MSPTELVSTLRRRGAILTAEGDGVRVRPGRVLTDEIRAAVRAAKPAILAILRSGVICCPRCGAPLDSHECCWSCLMRLCQRCGQAMPKPYARECDPCLDRLFAKSLAPRPLLNDQGSHLYPCPGCRKKIPHAWSACTACNPDWRTSPEKLT